MAIQSFFSSTTLLYESRYENCERKRWKENEKNGWDWHGLDFIVKNSESSRRRIADKVDSQWKCEREHRTWYLQMEILYSSMFAIFFLFKTLWIKKFIDFSSLLWYFLTFNWKQKFPLFPIFYSILFLCCFIILGIKMKNPSKPFSSSFEFSEKPYDDHSRQNKMFQIGKI